MTSGGYEDLIQSSNYRFKIIFDELRNWEASRNQCRKDNGDLAVLHNEEEERYFLEGSYSGHWVGYRRKKNNYNDWKSVEDSNFDDIFDTLEYCGRISQPKNDKRTILPIRCNSKGQRGNAICQKKKQGTSYKQIKFL